MLAKELEVEVKPNQKSLTVAGLGLELAELVFLPNSNLNSKSKIPELEHELVVDKY